jgi:rRNA processing protein Gar1
MLIVRDSKQNPPIGSVVVTNTMKRVGTVQEIFGPVSRPYISVKITKTNEKHDNQKLHVSENQKLYTL